MSPPTLKPAWISVLLSVLGLAAVVVAAEPAVSSGPVVLMSVDPTRVGRPISPLIYGINGLYETENAPERTPVCTVIRLGGNRTTAYNWVTNDSNAGADWHHQNDDYLGKSREPGEAPRAILDVTFRRGIAALLTVPIIGYVSADRNADGDVLKSGPDYLQTRFRRSVAAKGAPFSLAPDPRHPTVYQDEFVNWVKVRYAAGFSDPSKEILFALDNEVDLWASTHRRLRGITVPDGEKVPKEVEAKGKPTFEEIIERNVEYARAIKAVAPRARVLGPVVWSWVGLRDLSWAPGANGRVFAEEYLRRMAEEERRRGVRLVDLFTFNHYSAASAEVGGRRVEVTSQDTSPAVVAARLQAPRTFWDPAYAEKSWYVEVNGGRPLSILPVLREQVERLYPGTGIAITEYNFGGIGHISGALAQADFLGVLGREGVDLATWWPLGAKGVYVLGAFDLFLNHDGRGGRFGDVSVEAVTTDLNDTSVYAAVDRARPARLTLVVINKAPDARVASIRVVGDRGGGEARIYRLADGSPYPAPAGVVRVGGGGILELGMPGHTASAVVVERRPAGGR